MSGVAAAAASAAAAAVAAAAAAAAAGTPRRLRRRLCCCTARRPRWPAAARCASRPSLSQALFLKPNTMLTPQLSHSHNQVHRLPLTPPPSSLLPSTNELPARPHFSPQPQPRREAKPAASVRGEHPLSPPPLSAFAARPSTGPAAPTASRIAVKRSGATPRSRASTRDDTPFADASAPPPPLPGRPAAVAAAPPSVRKPPPDGALFSEVRVRVRVRVS